MAMPQDKPRSRVRWGAVLVSIGALFWLAQGGLLLASLPAVSGAFNLNEASSANNTTTSATTPAPTHLWLSENAVTKALGTFVLATVSAVLATVALAAGTLLIAQGAFGYRSEPGATDTSGRRVRFARRTRTLGLVASGFIAGFAVCGLVALAVLTGPGGGSLSSRCGGWSDGCSVTTAVEFWILGSALLLVGSEIFEVFTERLTTETRGRIRIHGAPFSNYAIVNFVALAVVPFAVVTGPTNGGLSDSLLYAVLFAQLFVVPVTGFVAWSWVAVHGFQSASRHAPGARVPEDEELDSWEIESGTERGPQGRGSSSYRRVLGDGRFSSSAKPIDTDWLVQLHGRVQTLERLVVAQNETISAFRKMLVRPRTEGDDPRTLPTTRIGRIESFGSVVGTAPVSPPPSGPPDDPISWAPPPGAAPRSRGGTADAPAGDNSSRGA